MLASVPIPVWLGVFVVVSAAFRYAQLASRMPAPWIFPDELIYSELAKSLGTTGQLAIRDVPFNDLSFGLAYPILIAPAYALTDSLPHAYAVARAINCAVMALAAVPTYLLARRLVRPALALVAAVLAVEIPSMAYSATIMSENLFYPVFLFAVLAIVRALEEPSRGRQLAAFGVIAVAVLTRMEALAFIPAYLTAIGVAGWAEARTEHSDDWISRLKAYRFTGGLVVGLASAALIFQFVRGKAVTDLLGAYDVVLSKYSLADAPKWFVYHLADLDLYVGVGPFVAAIVLAMNVLRGEEQVRPVRTFVAVSLGVVFWFTALAAAYATQAPAVRLHERYLFYVVPLLLIALFVWVERRPGIPTLAAAVAALTAAALPATIPFDLVVNRNMQASTPGLVPWGGFNRMLVAPPHAWAIALCVGIVMALAFLTLRRGALMAWTSCVILVFGVTGFFVAARHSAISRGAASWGASNPRDWIDRTVGPDSEVAVIWTGRRGRGLEGRYAIWENEIFNHSLGPVYDLREPLKRYVPETRIRVDPASGKVEDYAGRPLVARFVLTDPTFAVVGRPIARDARTGVVLYAVRGVVRAAPASTRP
jgi:hypothetical protein